MSLAGEIITIEDNRKNPRKPLSDLSFLKKQVIIKDASAQRQAQNNLVENIPLNQIFANTE